MNRERALELFPVFEAYANGETVQYLDSEGVWSDDSDFDPFEHVYLEYRIKPKAREFWLCWVDDNPDTKDYLVYPRDVYKDEHLVDHFEHYIKVREVI